VSNLEAIRSEQLRAALPVLVGERAGAFGFVLGDALDADPTRRFATAADMRAAWRAAALQATESKRPASAEPAMRTEMIRSWLHAAFAEQVRKEQERVARAFSS
jgi:hypothetical protein